VSLALALIFAAATFRRPKTEDERRLLSASVIIIAVLFVNAAICGVLSGVHARYQARLEWVLPAVVLAAYPLIFASFRRRQD
jgi:hypothetical protein